MPGWYPLVRAVRYYKGAFTPEELLTTRSCWVTFANEAEAAEARAQQIAYEMARQQSDLTK